MFGNYSLKRFWASDRQAQTPRHVIRFMVRQDRHEPVGGATGLKLPEADGPQVELLPPVRPE